MLLALALASSLGDRRRFEGEFTVWIGFQKNESYSLKITEAAVDVR